MGIEMTEKHFSEADLLETYYTQPGESMPVMMHLASCDACAARYDKLDRKLREVASCHTERPETFWSRQRLSIMKNVQRGTSSPAVQLWRAAAAAALAFLLGGTLVYNLTQIGGARATSQAASAVAAPLMPSDDEDFSTPADPWQTEELQDFQPVVQWESWVAETKSARGDKSL